MDEIIKCAEYILTFFFNIRIDIEHAWLLCIYGKAYNKNKVHAVFFIIINEETHGNFLAVSSIKNLILEKNVRKVGVWYSVV